MFCSYTIKLKICRIVMEVDNEYTTIFHFCTYSMQIIDIFRFYKKKQTGCLFGEHCVRELFQTLHDCNFALGPAIHTRMNDLDLISSAWVCQNYNCKLFLDLCQLLFNGSWQLHTLKRSSTICFV